jgi:hypothetical protein
MTSRPGGNRGQDYTEDGPRYSPLTDRKPWSVPGSALFPVALLKVAVR